MNTDRNVDNGVSPVVGVILMVAITVILAAVIGTFVLEFDSSEAPQHIALDDVSVTLGEEYRGCCGDETSPDKHIIRMTNVAGEAIDGGQVSEILIRYEGDDGNGGTVRYHQDGNSDSQEVNGGLFEPGDRLHVYIVTDNDDNFGEGDITGGSNHPGAILNGDRDQPFMATEGGFPIDIDIDRTPVPGDEFEIMLIDASTGKVVASGEATAREYDGTPQSTSAIYPED